MTDEEQIDSLLDQWEDWNAMQPDRCIDDFIALHRVNCAPGIMKRFRQYVDKLAVADRQLQEIGLAETLSAVLSTDRGFKIDRGLQPGQEPIPGYRLEAKLGQGGFGEVWRATGPGGFHLALKFVRVGGHHGEVELRALDVIRHVRHPHLLSVTGAWRVGEDLIIATELADRTLADRMKEAVKQGHVGIPTDELLAYITEAAEGIDFLNNPQPGRAPIVHRDIKPQNLLLSGRHVKVGDFGVVRTLQYDLDDQTGIGTPAFAAPECSTGNISNRSDQYSLAVTYFYLRSGRYPDLTADQGLQTIGDKKQSPTLMLPTELLVLARALERKPKDRWPSCQDFVAALSRAIKQPVSASPKGWKAKARATIGKRAFQRRVAIAVFAAIAANIFGLTIRHFGERPDPPTVAANVTVGQKSEDTPRPPVPSNQAESSGAASYERGFADTILRYSDRTYEGTKWASVTDALSLVGIANFNGALPEIRRFTDVNGWDSDTFWVAASGIRLGLVFESRQGHWSFKGNLLDCEGPIIRAINSDTLVAAGTDHSEKAFRLSPKGNQEFGFQGDATEIFVAAENEFHIHHTYKPGVFKVAAGIVREIPGDGHKDATVRRADNTPLREHPVHSVRLTRSFKSGQAFGLVKTSLDDDHMIVEFRSGVWYAVESIPDKEINQAWFGGDGSARLMVGVGNEGYVYVHRFGEGGVTRTLATPEEPTSMELIGVWGNSDAKFWVMDSSGTVWEQTENESRVIVQGMLRDNVRIKAVWVSPTGTVIAITEKEVYRLG